uniref:Uncharacterized protein n=1 Tax=Triticum urartu TaxID=4572 RepID=A0A8R7UDX1_TRIUA
MRPRLRAAPPYPSTLTAAVPSRTHYVLQYCGEFLITPAQFIFNFFSEMQQISSKLL